MTAETQQGGWIKLYRRLRDHPRFRDSEWVHVWIHLLLSATHKPYRVIFDGKEVTLQPGQMITGRHAIAESTGVHPSKVQRILHLLKTDQQIDQQKGAKGSIITVRNWQSYQVPDQQIDQQAISYRSASDQQAITNKKEKSVRTEEELPAPLPPAPSPAPVAPATPRPSTGAGRKPSSLDECLTVASMVGFPDEQARKWYRDMEASGWAKIDGTPFGNWRREMTIARDRARSQQAQPAHQSPQAGLSPSVQLMRDQKELERVERRMQYIRSSYDGHIDWTLEDKAEFRKLRERKEILKRQLGFTT